VLSAPLRQRGWLRGCAQGHPEQLPGTAGVPAGAAETSAQTALLRGAA